MALPADACQGDRTWVTVGGEGVTDRQGDVFAAFTPALPSPPLFFRGRSLPSSMLLFIQQGPKEPPPEKVDCRGLSVPSSLRPRKWAQSSFMPRGALSFLARLPRAWFSLVFLHYFFYS